MGSVHFRCRWVAADGAADIMKRAIDLLLVLLLLPGALIVGCVVAILVKGTSPGSVFYWSDRVGRYNRLFRMPKFRSMVIGTPARATHLLEAADSYITPVGAFIRRTSLDELPQLWSILKGDMSFVGPRPALHNQHDLVALRTERGVHALMPGLTGWAQVNGRDELTIPQKVELDTEYLSRRSVTFDLYIMCLTFAKVVRRDGVAH
jgi:O-antigen biosynthesis protein WbqP